MRSAPRRAVFAVSAADQPPRPPASWRSPRARRWCRGRRPSSRAPTAPCRPQKSTPGSALPSPAHPRQARAGETDQNRTSGSGGRPPGTAGTPTRLRVHRAQGGGGQGLVGQHPVGLAADPLAAARSQSAIAVVAWWAANRAVCAAAALGCPVGSWPGGVSPQLPTSAANASHRDARHRSSAGSKASSAGMGKPNRKPGSGVTGDLTDENCPRNSCGASGQNARETVTVVGHGEWVIDVVSCRDRVRQRVCQGQIRDT